MRSFDATRGTTADSWLVDTGWLRARLADPDLLLLDARKPGEYRRGHIPGAVSFDVFDYTNQATSQAALATLQADWAAAFGRAGVTPEKMVVVYDAGITNRAPRDVVMLRYLGHQRAYVLDGGLAGWIAGGGEVTKRGTRATAAPPIPIRPRTDVVATVDDVRAAVGTGDRAFLDVRPEAEHHGRARKAGNPRLGHVPGAAWLPWVDLLEDKRVYRPAEEIERLLAEQGITRETPLIVYCQRSHRASNTYLALRELGYRHARVYPGSWYEYSRQPDLPVERGAGSPPRIPAAQRS